MQDKVDSVAATASRALLKLSLNEEDWTEWLDLRDALADLLATNGVLDVKLKNYVRNNIENFDNRLKERNPDFARDLEAERNLERVGSRLTEFVNANSESRNLFYNRIAREESPQDICDAGIQEYFKTGQERYLLIVVSLLENARQDAWPALQKLAITQHSVCELFIPLIASCDGVAASKRRDALLALVHHPEKFTSQAVLENLGELPEEYRRTILKRFETNFHEDLREGARELLEELK
jgi:hypothetical protein